jgi:hypothetical protein
MRYATRPSVRVRIPKPRNPHRRRTTLKALTGGLAVAASTLGAVATVVVGTGWLFAASGTARSNIRSAALTPSLERPVWIGASAAGPAEPWTDNGSVSSSANARTPATLMLDPVGSLALIIPANYVVASTLSDPASTGSIGGPSFKPAPPNIAMAARLPAMPKLDDRPPPLPRTRPRLAALPPLSNLGIQADEDAHSGRTAIYDISGQVVYLPNGERLEAHSGLGQYMDDPRFVREKNRGATPPNTYVLKLRESLFHGVQAIRLTPVGDGNMFNRDGILAHSYMLGPNGQSNGCVSFRDYPRFLRAYLRGEFDRMVVVSRLDRPPAFATRAKVRSAANML